MTEPRKPLPLEPYRAFNGTILPVPIVAEYNRIQEQIAGWQRADRPVPEWLLDWSFRYFRDAIEA
jgi:hypothetical protein